MRAPDFWGEAPGPVGGLLSGLLTPIGVALDAAGRLRRSMAQPYHAPVPVACVGNLVAGGSGKTPVVLALAKALAGRGVAAHIVMRGYGGHAPGPLRVDPATHDALAVGDEALLAVAAAPCWVARDRAAGVRAAIAAGAEAILLDDGFQNPGVAKDVALVVVDAAYGFGNGRLIPAGPLRERVASGLARADFVVLIGEEPTAAPEGLADTNCPILHAALAPLDGARFCGERVVAFAGIGRPEKFFATLRRLGAAPVAERAFADHHPYRAAELAALRRLAAESGAMLVTTAKDSARLPPAARHGIAVLEVELRWRDDAALAPLLVRLAGAG
jgi:tetraacyldisaccharide 4'-kinase